MHLTILYFLYTQTHEAVLQIPDECIDGGYRSGSENYISAIRKRLYKII